MFYLITGPSALTVNITNNIESSSIVVQWDEVDDSLSTTYTVTWTSERDLNNVQVKTLIEQSSYTITGLTLDTVYTITVTANNRCGTGPEYSTSVILPIDATSYSLSSIGANSRTISSTESSIITTTTTTIMIANSSTATITNSAAYITPLSTTITTVVMNPGTTTINPITTAVSIIADTTSIFTKTFGLKTTTGNTNPSTSATTIVMSSTSAARNPADATTADETSKLLQ